MCRSSENRTLDQYGQIASSTLTVGTKGGICMAYALSMWGLILSSLGAILLIVFDIRERSKRSRRNMERANVVNELNAWKRNLRSVSDLLEKVNRQFHPTTDVESVSARTADIRLQIARLQTEIDSMDDINKKVLEELLPLTHPFAMALIAIGFALQALGLNASN